MRHVLLLLITTSLILSFCSCDQAAAYKRKERRELASGVRYDSLFLGMYLGMPSAAFYKHCWDLNKKELLKAGPGNSTVLYYPTDFKERTQMLFYPHFYNDKIYEMAVTFSYDAWAPWNKNLFSDKLQEEVVQVFEKWYGEGFIRLEHPKGGVLYAKIDGNRRISVWCEDPQRVRALFKDLTVDDKTTNQKLQ